MLFDTTIQNLMLILKHGKQVINAVLRFAVNAILITCKEIILILKHKISSIYFPSMEGINSLKQRRLRQLSDRRHRYFKY